jgi:hypothetical protein
MSWCRWGSKCSDTITQFAVDVACKDCPGSDLYIYEGDRLECCGCPLFMDFACDTEAEMLAHILEHEKAGHHVRRSLIEHASGRVPTVATSPASGHDASTPAAWKARVDGWLKDAEEAGFLEPVKGKSADDGK